MDMIPVESSWVAGFGYDAVSHQLHIRLKKGDDYLYRGVRRETFAALLAVHEAGGSVGAFLNAEIKSNPNYETYRRV
jgi:hypothetical protein